MQPAGDVVVAIMGASLAVQLVDAVMANAFFAFAGIFQMNTANGAQVHGSSSEISAPSQQRSRYNGV
jgi:hypothetical protein